MTDAGAPARLPAFDRGLVLAAPHGDHLAGGRKTALVRAQRLYIEGEVLLVLQGGRAVGTLVLAPPRAITLAAFRQLRGQHLVSEGERRRRWPRKTAFYLYGVVEFRPLERPVAVERPRGPQSILRPETLKAAS